MRQLIDKFRSLPRYIAITLALTVFFIAFVYYPVGMIVMHRIDDSPDFSATKFTHEGGSHSVAMTVALIDREVNTHDWTPNDPFFYPSSLLNRMPAFQEGMMASVARFAIELSDHIGRTRGSSQTDADLQKAAGLLNYSPTVWMFDFSTSWLPTTSSETQYRAGMDALMRYNKRLAEGSAVFERRSDNLMDTLDRIASDLGSASAALDEHVRSKSGLAFGSSGRLYYHTKGRMYGNYLLLRELEKDYIDVIREKQLHNSWVQMLTSLDEGMRLNNFLVMNAVPDSQFFPNHLTAQGFFLMRARTQLREITNILLK